MTDELDFWPRLVLAVLATWRITHLLAREDGPMGWIARLRARLGNGALGGMLDCFYCLSFWVAAPIALWISTRPLEWLLAWLALSGASCLCERIVEPRVVMQSMSEAAEGDENGMLRAETQRPSKRSSSIPGYGDDVSSSSRH